ncbi:hypothetical protein [Mariniflexile sp.]|uniref:hypothetical protein n=1 Tax=Mariniflexile sp. TaxID=1979402 RepID=UPI0035622BE7
MHKTVFDSDFKIEENDLLFDYQKPLTEKLDSSNKEFDQNILNEIVLWKVNRYADFDKEILRLINSIDTNQDVLSREITRKVLSKLLKIKGVQIAMASTIMRFRNPNVYQIIDQRVYRVIYKDKTLNLNTTRTEKNIEYQIELYLQYLEDLRNTCEKLNIPFSESDRILYKADKRINKDIKLKY